MKNYTLRMENAKQYFFSKRIIVLFLAVLLIISALYIRFTGLNWSLWHDEVVTMHLFVNNGMQGVLWENYTPNNHIFYSLVILILTSIFGFSEFLVRLPALITGFLAIICFFLIIKKNFGALASLLFLGFSLFNVEQVNLATQARGYGFVFLFSVLLFYYSYQIAMDQGKYNYHALTVISVLGVYTYPLFIVLAAVTYLQLFIMTRKWKQLLISGGFSFLFIIVLHIPIMNSFVEYYFGGAQSYGDPMPWYAFFVNPVQRIYSFVGGSIGQFIVLMQGSVVESLIILFFLIVGIVYIWKNNKCFALLILIPPTAFFVVAWLFSVPLVGRFSSFLSLHYIVLLSVGMAAVIVSIFSYHVNNKAKYVKLMMALLCSLIVLTFLLTSMQKSWDLKAMPYENFKDAFLWVKQAEFEDYVILTNSKRAVNFEFYAKELLGIDDVLVISDDDDRLILERIMQLSKDSNIVFFDHTFQREPYDGFRTLLLESNSFFTVDQKARGAIITYLIKKDSLDIKLYFK